MSRPEFSSRKVKKAVEVLTNRKVISEPLHMIEGFANEDWYIETDQGKLICKISKGDALLDKMRSSSKAIEYANSHGIPTNEIVVFKERCEMFDNRILRIYSWTEGVSPKSILNITDKDLNFFVQLGHALRKLHNIKLDGFSSRLNGTAPVFKTWKDYLNYRIPQIHKRALESRCFDIKKLNELWNRIYVEVSKINGSIYPTLTHRDLHLDNMVASRNGDLAAIIDFDSAEAWDPVADFYRLKWWVFNQYPSYEKYFLKGYGNPEDNHLFFKVRLQVIEVIELVNYVALMDVEDFVPEIFTILKNMEWKLPLTKSPRQLN